jgi:hypothetical protein
MSQYLTVRHRPHARGASAAPQKAQAVRLLHGLDGFRVALPGSPPEVLTGEAHVVDLTEEAAAKHLD